MKPLAQRLEERWLTPRSDCKIWTGATERGYGRIVIDGVSHRVHRVAWELTNGPIPEGMTIDHLCGIKPCFNLDHLQLSTRRDNGLKGLRDFAERRRAARPDRRDVCSAGHPLTPDNVTTRPNDPDYRICRQCRRKYDRDRYAKKKSA